MEASKKDKKEILKDLACEGNFEEIKLKFGSLALEKAKSYVSKKISMLREIGTQDVGEKPFLLFAVKQDPLLDVTEVSDRWYQHLKEDYDLESLDEEEETKSSQKLEEPLEEGRFANDDAETIKLASVNVDAESRKPKGTQKSKKQKDDGEYEGIEGHLNNNGNDDQNSLEGEIKPKSKKKPFAKPTSGESKKMNLGTPAKVRPSKGSENLTATKKKAAKLASSQPVRESNKLKKDPRAPKGPKNAYMFFNEEHRKALLDEDPKPSIIEVSTMIGKMWNELTVDEKRFYQEKAVQDKARYQEEWEAYLIVNPDADNDRKRSRDSKGKGGKRAEKGKQDNSSPCPRVIPVRAKVNRMSKSNILDDIDAEESDQEKQDREATDTKSDCSEVSKSDNSSASSSDDGEKPRKKSKVEEKRNSKSVTSHLGSSSKKKFAVTHSKCKSRVDDGKSQKVISLKQKGSLYPPGNVSRKLFEVGKGIKQSQLHPDIDLLNTKTIPRRRGVLSVNPLSEAGMDVVLLLAPYREFISSLPIGLLSAELMQDIQEVCSCENNIIFGKIQEAHDPALGVDTYDPNAMGSIRVVGIRPLNKKVSSSVESHKVLSVAFASSLLQSDKYLIPKHLYDSSLRASWLHPGAQVRRLFAACDDNSDSQGNHGDGEWYEGTIYYIRKDVKSNPFHAVMVVWLEQEESTTDWIYAYTQTDSECSPWDLEISSYVLAENMKPPTFPKALRIGTPTANAILNYVKGLDFVYPFMLPAKDIPEYKEMFPEEKDQLDIPAITKLCAKGRYDDGCGVGVMTLFDDLQRMVNNGKAFNSSNVHFQPWRLADMLDRELINLREFMSRYHPELSELLERVSFVEEEEQEFTQEHTQNV